MRRTTLRSLVGVIAAVLVLSPAHLASAHEHRLILNGKYELVVGFVNEPAVSGELNSLDLRVSDLTQATPAADGGEATGAPVEGLEETLTVDIIFVDQTKTLELEPRFRTLGAYNAYVIPVQPGDYVFHISGTINGEPVDEIFTPGPETFSSVVDRATLEFPQASALTDGMAAGITSGSGDIGGSDLGGLLASLAGLLAVVSGSQFLRRRSVRPSLAVHAPSAGD